MFDTNIFNRIVDGQIDDRVLTSNQQLFATHIQHDEISKTVNAARRQLLLSAFRELISDSIPTETFVLDHSRLDEAKLGDAKMLPTTSAAWDVSSWDQSGWGDEDDMYSSIKSDLDKLNNGKANNIQDALIAETAMKNNLVLVTDDRDLLAIARHHITSACSRTNHSQRA